jgi:DNA-binding CsgD family transcriptional regulator
MQGFRHRAGPSWVVVGHFAPVDAVELELPYSLGARRLRAAMARRLVAAGLVLAATNAMIAAVQEAFGSGPDRAGRVVASVVLAGIPIAGVARRRAAVALLERQDRWLLAWAMLAVAAFAIDGPGDQLLLPAALGPVAMAGLVGRPRRAVTCAAIIDVGYLGLLAAYGSLSFGGGGLHLAAENAALVLLTVVVTALPVRIAMGTTDDVPRLLSQLSLAPARRPESVAARRGRGLLGPSRTLAALPERVSTPDEPLLTDQERRVLRGLRDGRPYKVIALDETRILGRACSRHRVYRIVAEIKRKVGARSRNQLAGLDESEFAC